MRKTLNIQALALCIILFGAPLQAFYPTMETGEVVEEGQYKITGFGHWILDDEFSGFNLQGAFDTYASESSSFRFNLATGSISFLVGGSFKWIPIPDYEDQPALGLTGGLSYALFDSESVVAFHGTGLASKRFEIEFGQIIPFVTIPFGMTFYDGEVFYPLNFNLGGELVIESWDNLSFLLEASFNLHDSHSSVNFGVGYLF